MPNHQRDVDPLKHMSPYTNTIHAKQGTMISYKFLENIYSLLYKNPYLINLSVNSLCLITKLLNVSHVLLILKSCEIHTYIHHM